MWNDKGVRIFALAVACAAGFVAWTGSRLPDTVASHFAAGGAVDGAMPRCVYLPLILFLTIGLPCLSVLVSWSSLGRPGARINLPHVEYWLAPERRAQTIAAIRGAMLQFAALLLLFLCYAHWLVVRANQSRPARLDETWFLSGLLVFLVIALTWVLRFVGRFRRTG